MSETLNIDEQIKEIDNGIETQEWFLKRGEALKRLKENENQQFGKSNRTRIYRALF